MYAAKLADSTGGSKTDYAGFLRRVVLKVVRLDDTTDPLVLGRPETAGLVDTTHVESLRTSGIVVLPNALGRCGIDCRALQADLEMLWRGGVIAPSTSTCNPGAHGVMLRCGSAVERAQFQQQRTHALLSTIELMRSVPAALDRAGYKHPHPLRVPPSVLVSAYPDGAAYQAHYDSYGADSVRALTLIVYANSTWGNGAGGRLRAVDRREATVEVEPSGGTLVIFDSRLVKHEVLPSRQLRFAVTLWVHDESEACEEVRAMSAEAAEGLRPPGLELSAPPAGSDLLQLVGLAEGTTQWVWRDASS